MSTPTPAESLTTAWQIHAAQIDWTGKADAKASFALALESGLLAGIVTLSSGKGALAQLFGWTIWPYRTGVLLIVLSALFALAVVFPQLRRWHLKDEAKSGAYIYFGHARRHTALQQQRLIEQGTLIEEVSAQIVRMADIAWRKHNLLQASLVCAVVGAGLVFSAGIWK